MLRRAAELAPALGGVRRLSHWATLSVPKGSSNGDVKAAYRALSLRWHPDVCSDVGADRKMRAINEAYAALTLDGGTAATAEQRAASAAAAAAAVAEERAATARRQAAAADMRDAERRRVGAAEKDMRDAERRRVGAAAKDWRDTERRRVAAAEKAEKAEAAAEQSAAVARREVAAAAEAYAAELCAPMARRQTAAAADQILASDALRRADSRMATAAEHGAASEPARRMKTAVADHKEARGAALQAHAHAGLCYVAFRDMVLLRDTDLAERIFASHGAFPELTEALSASDAAFCQAVNLEDFTSNLSPEEEAVLRASLVASAEHSAANAVLKQARSEMKAAIQAEGSPAARRKDSPQLKEAKAAHSAARDALQRAYSQLKIAAEEHVAASNAARRRAFSKMRLTDLQALVEERGLDSAGLNRADLVKLYVGD